MYYVQVILVFGMVDNICTFVWVGRPKILMDGVRQ